MTTEGLLQHLTRQGVRLSLEADGALTVSLPEGRADLKPLIAQHRNALKSLLAQSRTWIEGLSPEDAALASAVANTFGGLPLPEDSPLPEVLTPPTHPYDPRPDLEDDASLWAALLAAAYRKDPSQGGVYGVLHGMRCWGAALKRTGNGLQLAPRYGPGGWDNPEQWRADKAAFLAPHKDAIRKLFVDNFPARLTNTPLRPYND